MAETKDSETITRIGNLMRRFTPDPDLQLQVAQIFAESIDVANEINPAVWVVTLGVDNSDVRLNVGRVFALTLRPGSLNVIFNEDNLRNGGVEAGAWEAPAADKDVFHSLPGARTTHL